ncbi:hypothetical protein KL86PLE_100253 [uncultured Pleomorphomonas sp.]|uniref:Uncharacterized protein n=1 Tax=uncultured Pleomorphomonas sp. TaxID=442121 RepID=A0A212L1W0_9HYPH|nr:hypothetical protein KL86PLE_100253 [uncultured Pleomorphomonas sp.]
MERQGRRATDGFCHFYAPNRLDGHKNLIKMIFVALHAGARIETGALPPTAKPGRSRLIVARPSHVT